MFCFLALCLWLPEVVHSKPDAVAIGGALGGLAAFSAVVLVLLYRRKRTSSRKLITPLPFPINPLLSPQSDVSKDMSSISPPTTGSDTQETTTPRSISFNKSRNMITPAHTPNLSVSVAPAPHDSAPAVARPTSPPVGHGLSGIQVNSLHALLRQNIPGPIVATVMESMLGGEAPSTTGHGSRVGVEAEVVDHSGTSPPAYERTTSTEGSILRCQ